MTKSELIESALSKLDSDATKADVERNLNAILAAITEGLKQDGSVALVGFGTFSVTQRSARTGRNPATGAAIHIPASKSVKFKAGKGLVEKFN